MNGVDGLGDVVIGSLAARAVEPQAGEGAGHTHERACLNCGAALVGDYCSACGQRAHIHRSIAAFFHDLLHGVFHFEGKIWRTLPMLVWRPGDLTRRYIEGQRASFVSPIALFLFCVFLLFAVIGFTSGNAQVAAKTRADVEKELKADQQKLAALRNIRVGASGAVASGLDEQISDLQSEMNTLNAVKNAEIDAASFNIQRTMLGHASKRLERAAQNPELLFYKLKTNAYKFSWALIPISVPFVWLLFPFNRRFQLYDHTVFVTYSLCFMMLLLSAASIVGLVSESIVNIAWFVPPVHMYRQLKGAYGLSRAGAIWRAVLLAIFAFIAISLFASLLVTLGAFE